MTQPDTNVNVTLDANVDPYQQAMSAAGRSTNDVISAVVKLNDATNRLFRTAGHKLELISAGSMAGIGAAVTSLSQLDAQLRTVRATAALTGGTDIPKLAAGLRTMNTQIPVSTQQLAQLAATIQSLGVRSSSDILKLTNTFAKLGAATGESASGLAQSLGQLTRSMGESLDPGRINALASALANTSAKLGVSATATTQFAQALQPLGKLLGLTETQLIGISGAFNKAGADGTAAATAFTQIASMITNDIQTGNPQIKQFADILGVSVDQFKAMQSSNPAQMLNDLFTTLGQQGPRSLQILQSLGLDGPRSLQAIQRVSQGGGLREGINAALGGERDPGKLTKASSAAFNDLQSNLDRLGSTIKELTTGPFVLLERSLSKIVAGVNAVLGAFVKFTNLPGVHQLIEVFATIAGFLSPLLGLAGALVSLIPTLAALGIAWQAVFSKSGISLVGGMRDAIRGTTSSVAAERIAASRLSVAGGGPRTVSATQAMAYRAGGAMGTGLGAFGVRAAEGEGPGAVRQAAGLGFRGGRWMGNQVYGQPIRNLVGGVGSSFWGGFRGWAPGGPEDTIRGGAVRGAAAQAYDRPNSLMGDPNRWAAGRARAGQFVQQVIPGMGAAGAAREGEAAASTNALTGALTGLRTRVMSMTETMTASIKSMAGRTKVEDQTTVATAAAGRSAAAAAAGLNEVAGAAIRAGAVAGAGQMALPGMGAGELEGGAGAVGGGAAGGGMLRGGARLAGRGLGMGARGLGTVMGAAMSPMGMGIGLAAFGGYEYYKALQGTNKPLAEADAAKQQGTFLGNINALNTATNQGAVSMKDLDTAAQSAAKNLGAIQKPGTTQDGAAKPFSAAEVQSAIASGFKATGYDPKSRASQTSKVAQEQLTMIGKITQNGKLSADEQRQMRMSLEHLMPDNIKQAEKIWRGWSQMTGGFKHIPVNPQSGIAIGQAVGSQYMHAVHNAGVRDFFTGMAYNAPGARRAKALLAGDTGYVSVLAREATTPGMEGTPQQKQLAAQMTGMLAGLFDRVSKASGNDRQKRSIFREVAIGMGLPADYGNVSSFAEFVNKIMTSKSASVRATGKQLITPGVDFTQGLPAVTSQLQKVSGQAQTQINTQSRAALRGGGEFGPQGFNLAPLGIRPGSQLAGQVISTLKGSTDPATQTRAIQGTAEALVHQGLDAAQATKAISDWSAHVDQSTDAGKQFASAVEDSANALLDMQQSTMSLPQQLGAIQSRLAALNKHDPNFSKQFNQLNNQLQQTYMSAVQQAQQYLQAQDQTNRAIARQQYDFNLSVSRSNKQFHLQESRSLTQYNLQVSRSNEDFHLSEVRAQADFNQQMLYQQQDYQRSRARAQRDFDHQEELYVKQAATALDPWSQVQAQSVADSGQLLANLRQQSGMFATAKTQLDKLRGLGLNQDVVDTLGLSDPQNMQKLDRFYKDVAANPKLINSFNSTIKGRLDWTKGLATDKSSTQWREMEHQFKTAASDAATDFGIASKRAHDAFDKQQDRSEKDFEKQLGRAAKDFHTTTVQAEQDYQTQLDNMRTDEETSTKRALDDLNQFEKDTFASADTILQRAMNRSKGHIHDFFADVIAEYQSAHDQMQSINSNSGSPASSGGSGSNPFSGVKGQVFATMKAAGYSDTAIAGVMGNISKESHFDPTALGPHGAFGLAQWQGARLAALKKYARLHHESYRSAKTQIDFMISELNSGRYVNPGQLNREPSAALAANLINDRYEVSADKGNDRPRAATGYYGQIVAARSTKLHSPVSGSLHRGRTDQGVDWSGAGSIYAVGAGKMTKVIPHDPGWLGSFMVLQLAHPPSADRRFVYYAEGITPKVKTGQHVNSGQVIGRATGSSTGIEIGWASSATGQDTLARERGHQAKGSDPGATASPEGKDFLHYIGGHASGGVVLRHEIAQLGEKGPEAVIPLNAHGAHFVNEILNRFNLSAQASSMGNRFATPVSQTVNNTHIDSSTNFTGDITVQSQDPNEMARKLANRKRMAALTAPDLTGAAS